jgi:hypothetical protein
LFDHDASLVAACTEGRSPKARIVARTGESDIRLHPHFGIWLERDQPRTSFDGFSEALNALEKR